MGIMMGIKTHNQKYITGAGIPDDIAGKRAGIFHLLRTQATVGTPQDLRGQPAHAATRKTPPIPTLPPLQLTPAQRLRTWQDLLTADCFVFSQPERIPPR